MNEEKLYTKVPGRLWIKPKLERALTEEFTDSYTQ